LKLFFEYGKNKVGKKGGKMRRAGRKKIFTLLEVMMVTIVVLIVAGLGVLSYRQVVENARQRVCALNLKALGEAIKFYSLEEDKLPATLGELKLRHLRKAYAKVMREGNYLLNKLSFFIVKINTPSLAYGDEDERGPRPYRVYRHYRVYEPRMPRPRRHHEPRMRAAGSPRAASVGFLTPDTLEEYGVTEEVFHCPDDPSGEVSYAINQNLAGKKWEDIAPGTPLVVCTSCPDRIGDNLFDPSTGEGICGRHFKNLGATKNISQALLKGGIIVKGKKEELTGIFSSIESSCITGYWQDCSGKTGKELGDCRRYNNERLSDLMGCIKSYIPHRH